MVRRHSAANIRNMLQHVYNSVNITFPPEFGAPLVTQTAEGFVACFPEHVHMQTAVKGRTAYYRAIGEGETPVMAIANLFEEYVDETQYDRIAVVSGNSSAPTFFSVLPRPYGTTSFIRTSAAA